MPTSACNSTLALLQACFGSFYGGVTNGYLIAKADLSASTQTRQVYSADTTDKVIKVYRDTAYFQPVYLVPDTSGLSFEGNIDRAKGLNAVTLTFTIQINGNSPEKRAWVESIRDEELVMIYETADGETFIIGHNGRPLQMKTLKGGTGIKWDDGVSTVITLEQVALKTPAYIDSSILAGLIAP